MRLSQAYICVFQVAFVQVQLTLFVKHKGKKKFSTGQQTVFLCTMRPLRERSTNQNSPSCRGPVRHMKKKTINQVKKFFWLIAEEDKMCHKAKWSLHGVLQTWKSIINVRSICSAYPNTALKTRIGDSEPKVPLGLCRWSSDHDLLILTGITWIANFGVSKMIGLL